MRERRVQVAIIGAGSAGLAARRELELRRVEYVLIERGPYGTTCARVGCMPSKLLIAAAEAAHRAREASVFGITVPDVRVDSRAVMERVRKERDRFVGFVVEATDSIPDGQRITGSARFVGPNELLVNGEERVFMDATIVATGSSAWIPPVLEPLRARTIINDDVFELPELPESMVVFGTGIIGLELGQALARLGVRVSFLSPSNRLGPLSDPALRAKALQVFGGELDLHLDARDVHAEAHGERGVKLRWQDSHGAQEATFATVLAAAGRRPNVAGLGLEAAGITLEAGELPRVDRRTMRVGETSVFLAGDVSAERPVLHEAADDGRIAAVNAALHPRSSLERRRTPLTVMFSDPQIAVVGSSHRELAEGSFVTGEVDYDDQGRARVMNEHRGLVRIYVERRSGVLLGAEMFGPRVEHTAHLLAWAIDQQLTVGRVLEMPFYHPVVEEGIRTALRDAARQLELIAAPCPHQLDCGPGS